MKRRSGLTLVEVIAALVILTVLLGGVLGAQRRALEQLAKADARLRAVDAVESLLDSWCDPVTGAVLPPTDAKGELDGTLRWTVELRQTPETDRLLGNVLHLTVNRRSDGEVLLRLQLITPDLGIDNQAPEEERVRHSADHAQESDVVEDPA